MLVRILGVAAIALLLASCTATALTPMEGSPHAQSVSRSDTEQQAGGGGGGM